jgi:hypothetical protein
VVQLPDRGRVDPLRLLSAGKCLFGVQSRFQPATFRKA